MLIHIEPKPLDIPGELLERIAEYVGTKELKSLKTIRLICKAFDAAVMDRFADAFIKRQHHWHVFDETRWMLLHKILKDSPRLANRLERLAFTIDSLEHKQWRVLEYATLEEEFKEEDPIELRLHRLCTDKLNCTIAPSECAATKMEWARAPNIALVNEVLQALAFQYPKIAVGLSLTQPDLSSSYNNTPQHREVLLAVVSSDIRIISLVIHNPLQPVAQDVFTHTSSRLLQRLPLIQEFRFADFSADGDDGITNFSVDWDEKIQYTEYPSFVRDALTSAECMRTLTLRPGPMTGAHLGISKIWRPRVIPDELLFANSLSNLSSLSLESLMVSSKSLQRALSRCISNLKSFTLLDVILLEADAGWFDVFLVLSQLPYLDTLFCLDLGERPEATKERDIATLRGPIPPVPDCIDCSGRSDVRKALHEHMEEWKSSDKYACDR